jgi:hypothetical protein
MALPSEYDSRFWLVILHELDAAGGVDTPSRLYPRMRQYFPDITDQDIQTATSTGGNKWTNMIQWARQHLVYRGCIDNSNHGKWALTETGRKWLEAEWRDPGTDYSKVQKPPILNRPSPKNRPKKADHGSPSLDNTFTTPDAKPRRNVQLQKEAVLPPKREEPEILSPQKSVISTLTTILDPVSQLGQRIRAAQRRSDLPKQFEQVLAEAFAVLGFTSRHIGGASEPDILVTARLGQGSYSIVVDAKSTHTGRVTDGQISWPVIDSYRQKHNATFAAVVGEDFSGGNLQTFANQYKVALITTGMICDLVRLHNDSPFSLPELKDLFSIIGRADPGVQALIERNQRNARHWQLISEVVETIDRFQQTGPGGAAPKIDNLQFHLMLKNSQAPSEAPTLQDVTDAVAFLASRAVNVLVEVPGSSGAYQLAMSQATARKRLLALSRFFDEQPAGPVNLVTRQSSI